MGVAEAIPSEPSARRGDGGDFQMEMVVRPDWERG